MLDPGDDLDGLLESWLRLLCVRRHGSESKVHKLTTKISTSFLGVDAGHLAVPCRLELPEQASPAPAACLSLSRACHCLSSFSMPWAVREHPVGYFRWMSTYSLGVFHLCVKSHCLEYYFRTVIAEPHVGRRELTR